MLLYYISAVPNKKERHGKSMAKFCEKCGNELKDGAKFCSICGAPMQGGSAEAPPESHRKKTISTTALKQAAQTAASLLQSTSNASSAAGETLLSSGSAASIIGGLGKVTEILSPFKVILSGAKNMITSFRAAIKDKKKLLPAIILALTWLFLTLLPALGINPLPIKVLSFLTFAQGGMSNNVFRILGGVIGKTVFAAFVFKVLGKGNLIGKMKLFLKDHPINKIKLFFSENPKEMIKGYVSSLLSKAKSKAKSKVKGSLKTPAKLVGVGCAMIFFKIMVGTASPWSLMAGVAAIYLSLKAAGGGFLYRLVTSVFAKIIKGDLKLFVNSFMSGLTLGFGIGTAMGLVSIGVVLQFFGILILVISAVWFVILLLAGKGGAGGVKEAGL